MKETTTFNARTFSCLETREDEQNKYFSKLPHHSLHLMSASPVFKLKKHIISDGQFQQTASFRLEIPTHLFFSLKTKSSVI